MYAKSCQKNCSSATKGEIMKKYIIAVALSALLSPAVSFAQDPIIYPAKGQDTQQTEKDKFECYGWAKGQTGFDPMQSTQTSTPPPAQTSQPNRGRSVVRGASVGGLAGSMGGEFGKGAAVGAAAGVVGGGKVSVGRPVNSRRNKTHRPDKKQTTIPSIAASIIDPLAPVWKVGGIRLNKFHIRAYKDGADDSVM